MAKGMTDKVWLQSDLNWRHEVFHKHTYIHRRIQPPITFGGGGNKRLCYHRETHTMLYISWNIGSDVTIVFFYLDSISIFYNQFNFDSTFFEPIFGVELLCTQRDRIRRDINSSSVEPISSCADCHRSRAILYWNSHTCSKNRDTDSVQQIFTRATLC